MGIGGVAFCLQRVGLRKVRVGKSTQYVCVGLRRLSVYSMMYTYI